MGLTEKHAFSNKHLIVYSLCPHITLKEGNLGHAVSHILVQFHVCSPWHGVRKSVCIKLVPPIEPQRKITQAQKLKPSTKKHQCYFLMPWSERHLSLQLSLPMFSSHRLTTSAHADGRPAGNETWLAEKSIRMEVCSSENQRQMDTNGLISIAMIDYDWLPKAKTNLVSASNRLTVYQYHLIPIFWTVPF